MNKKELKKIMENFDIEVDYDALRMDAISACPHNEHVGAKLVVAGELRKLSAVLLALNK
jgi:hypothetical protein